MNSQEQNLMNLHYDLAEKTVELTRRALLMQVLPMQILARYLAMDSHVSRPKVQQDS